MGSLLEAKSVYQSIDGIEMSQHEKAKAKARMRKADAIANALQSVINGLLAALGRPVQTLVPGPVTQLVEMLLEVSRFVERLRRGRERALFHEPPYSAVIPASLMILDHFAISALMNASNSAGVPLAGSRPTPVRRS